MCKARNAIYKYRIGGGNINDLPRVSLLQIHEWNAWKNTVESTNKGLESVQLTSTSNKNTKTNVLALNYLHRNGYKIENEHIEKKIYIMKIKTCELFNFEIVFKLKVRRFW